MAEIFIENIAGLIKSENVPTKDDGLGNQIVNTSVIWAKEIAPISNPDKVQLLIYDFELADWIPLYNTATEILLGSVIDFLADPPVSPNDGDSYVIESPATGAWLNREGQVATWDQENTVWDFQSPTKNAFILVITLETFYYYSDDYPSGTWNIALGGSAATFDGSRPIKRVPYVGLVPGGTTQKQFMENLYYPFISAVLSLNDFTLQEVGINFDPQIVGTLTPNDELTITDRRVIDVTGGNIVLDNPAGNAINYSAPTIAITEGIVNQYKLEADVDDNGNPKTISSVIRSVNGAFPFLVGLSDQNLGTADLFTLPRIIMVEGDITIELNGTNQYIYCCFISDYADLVDIKNNSDFSIINNFTKTLVNVDSIGLDNNYTKEFKVYKLNNLTNPTGTYKFLR